MPPYIVRADTILSPALARFKKVYVAAAAPEATPSAATPPSRAAMRFSKTSWVGFVSLL